MNTALFLPFSDVPVTPTNAIAVAKGIVVAGKAPAAPVLFKGDGFSVLYDGTSYKLELSPLVIAAGLAKAGVDSAKLFIAGENVTVSAAFTRTRLDICRSCDAFEAKGSRCSQCGCHMPTKAKLAAAECPLSKWPVDRSC